MWRRRRRLVVKGNEVGDFRCRDSGRAAFRGIDPVTAGCKGYEQETSLQSSATRAQYLRLVNINGSAEVTALECLVALAYLVYKVVEEEKAIDLFRLAIFCV